MSTVAYNKDLQSQQGSTVTAQPVVYSAQTYAAQPTPQPVVVNATASRPATTVSAATGAPPIAYIQRPPANRWGDEICDWPKNLFPSCWCACCCHYGVCLLGQMAQKTGFGNFNTVVWTYVFLFIFALILQLVFRGSGAILWIPFSYCLIYSIMLRLHIVRLHDIRQGGSFAECCWGFWCYSCSVSQMARHLYGYRKVLDGDGDPDRPDNYPPVGVIPAPTGINSV